MPPEVHALLGPSSAHRWLNCPPSMRWEAEDFPEDTSSEAAAEGTLAHAIAESHLRQILDGKKKITTPRKLTANPLYKAAMEEYVDEYVEYVLERYNTAKATAPDALLMLEQRVDFSRWVPEGHGTADAVIIADGTMHIIDLKYGKGVPVTAIDNPQIRLYAVGAYEEFSCLYDIVDIALHIVQPRLDSQSTDFISPEALMQWVEFEVAPKARLAWDGAGDFAAGDWCRFCRCKYRCKAYRDAQMETAMVRFTEMGEERKPNELTNEEIGKFMEGADELVRWAKGVKEWALDQAVNHGEAFPGWKLVAGRSNRQITDKPKAVSLLTEAGFRMEDVTELRGIGGLEDAVGAKNLETILGDLIIKPTGKPVLAPETDKRPALDRAEGSMFTPVD